MYSISSSSKINYYLKKYNIADCFGSSSPVFTLHHYLPGELLASPFEVNPYLQFIVEGDVILYEMPSEDSFSPVESPFYRARLIGEIELIDSEFKTFFVEAKTDVYTLALPVSEYREKLLQDNTFLLFLSRTLANKLTHAVQASHKLPLREQLIRYILSLDCSEPIRNMSNLSYLLHVSTRQLSRALNELVEEGYLERAKKGTYIITDKIRLLTPENSSK